MTRFFIAVLLTLTAAAHAGAPPVDHHQHLLSPMMIDAAKGERPIAAADLVAMLDAAGIRRAVILSNAYRVGTPGTPAAPDEYARVMAENDWTATEAAKFPRRLVAFCGIDPLKDYALAEIARCAAERRFGRGIKLQLGWSMVHLDDPAHVAKLRAVFAAADKHGLALVVHLRTRLRWPYGVAQAQVFLDEVLSAAPHVTVQIAHLTGGGGGSVDAAAEQALGVFTAAISRRDPRVSHLIFDTAGITGAADAAERAPAIAQRLREIGIARIVYGSDGGDPTDPPAKEALAAFRSLPLTPRELGRIENHTASYLRH